MSNDMRLSFECGALDKEPVVFTGLWFQITYCEVRDEDGNMIAHHGPEGYWIVEEPGKTTEECEGYSDIVISQDVES